MDTKEILGKNVRNYRKICGISQEDLAEKSGLHRTYISGVERGLRNPTVSVVGELAKALGVSIPDLFQGV